MDFIKLLTIHFISPVVKRLKLSVIPDTPQFHPRPSGPFCILSTNYNAVIMGAIASQITSLTIVYSIVCSDADQRKHQSSASLAFVCGIHRGPVNSPHKWPVTRKIFPFDDVIMWAIMVNTSSLGTNICHQWWQSWHHHKSRHLVIFNRNCVKHGIFSCKKTLL